MKVLQDKTQKLAVLFNCRTTLDGRLLCGAAVFRGGLSGELSLFNENNQEFKIQIPEYVSQNSTYIIKSHPADNLEICLA